MVPNKITDSDMIILNSVESYLKSIGTPNNQNPQERLFIYQQARDYLYSDIVQRVPRVASYILSSDLETNTVAQGLHMALSKHVMDPVFINLLMQYMGTRATSDEEHGIVGAYLTKILNKWMMQNITPPATATAASTSKEKDKKKATEEVVEKPAVNPEKDFAPVEHLKKAIDNLLGQLSGMIALRSGNITSYQALAVAACVAMNNQDTIREIIESDFPVTADIFDCVKDPSNLIRTALLIDKADIPKLTTNSAAFVESLKRWVYDKLNILQQQVIYQFLVATYGTQKPDVTTKLINPKDCGQQYSNLFDVARLMINQK